MSYKEECFFVSRRGDSQNAFRFVAEIQVVPSDGLLRNWGGPVYDRPLDFLCKALWGAASEIGGIIDATRTLVFRDLRIGT